MPHETTKPGVKTIIAGGVLLLASAGKVVIDVNGSSDERVFSLK
jgi:hypothetical protein